MNHGWLHIFLRGRGRVFLASTGTGLTWSDCRKICQVNKMEFMFCFSLCSLCVISWQYFVFCAGLNVYALSSISATEIDRLMREATRNRSTSISSECIDGKATICCSVLVCWLTVESIMEGNTKQGKYVITAAVM